MLTKKSIQVRKHTLNKFDSFEYMDVLARVNNEVIRIVVIYRPPLSRQGSSTNFFDDFSTLAEQLATASGNLLIVGDLNLHLDAGNDLDAMKFQSILESFNLKQHVTVPTHSRGHTLDLIITRSDVDLVDDIVVKNPALSDHLAVLCKLKLKKLPAERREVFFRKLRSININSLRSDLKSSTAMMEATADLSDQIDKYEYELSRILDNHAPVRSHIVIIRPLAPWYNSNIDVEKKNRRKLERRWRKSRLTIDRELYQEQCKLVSSMIKDAKTNYYSNIINENKGNQKVLFNTIDKLLHRNVEKRYPTASSANELANTFADFFHKKIELIRNDLSADCTAVINPHPDEGICSIELDEFKHISEAQIKNLIDTSRLKSCILDPFPASILKSCIDILLPIFTRIVNMSLETATMPTQLKEVVLTPKLKKDSLA